MTSGLPLHESLWQQNLDLARACRSHPFIRGLADGTLDPQVFRRYVAQDAFFLRAFMGAYALAAAKCSHQLELVRRFHRLMGGVLDELELHASFAEALSIDLDAVEPSPAASAYTDFLTRTAWTDAVDEIVAAMTPCMRLYRYLGQEMAGADHANNPYRDWVETYSSTGFGELVKDLEAIVDELGVDNNAVRRNYRYAMRCELDFFSDPLRAATDEGT